MIHKDLTEQIDRVRQVKNGKHVIVVYDYMSLTLANNDYMYDLQDIAYAAIERIDQEHEANK